MANAISVGGMQKLINKAGDQVLDDLKRFANNTSKVDNPTFESKAGIKVAGKFAFDKKGNFGIVANIVGGAGAISADLDADTSNDWASVGDGVLEIEYSVKVVSTRDDVPSAQ